MSRERSDQSSRDGDRRRIRGQRHDVQPADLIERMFHDTADGVYAVDRHMRITIINEAALRVLGLKRSEAMGRPCHEVMRFNICREYCALRAARASQRPIVNLAVDILQRDGRRSPVILSSSVLHDAEGRDIGGVETIRDLGAVQQSLRRLERQKPLEALLTSDEHMQNLFELLPTLAASESCILITGETGTGKNLVARAVHDLSERRGGPFVSVNCAALPDTLIESELFGYRAGAFTGATRDRVGRIGAAEGGTLFMDEIGDIPLAIQVKLLRFLQDRTYERLGDVKPVRADVRLVAATNQDLVRMVDEGGFRRDLYYRVNVLNVHLPPLRERRGDIPLLVERFLERLSVRRGKQVTRIARSVLERLQWLEYPGNVRELENIVEHAFVMCDGPTVEDRHLPPAILKEGRRAASNGNASETLVELEARFLREALVRHDWNRQAVAEALGIHRTTLLRRIKRLGLKVPRRDGRNRPRQD